MKNALSLICGILFTGTLFAQGTIQSIIIDPPSPTASEFVRAYVNISFTTGGCAVDNQGHSTILTFTDAYAHHCLGELTVICEVTDTFNLGFLEPGDNTFSFTLTSGIGGPPCTPGIIPDDLSSVTFTVSSGTGINDPEAEVPQVAIYPNPFNTTAKIKIDAELRFNKAEVKIIDTWGRTAKVIEGIQTNEIILRRDDLVSGIYFYQLIEKEKTLASGKIIIE